ncbi:murein biosynthesis integral membrane protein MurJ, partial [Mesorhizobium sp. M7A.F.Ca.CA.001.13.1.1]|uniref:murein biosynthesis integral membrane protein MurJ n=1 Tax=Mesorhizobium sp. M7A.F.Ca.CA.001.13.1.1 TaxID=2496728 RepID=UPI000FCA2F91
MSLVKKFATVASGTLMSRALGFGREMLMAAALGTGPVADAFNAAFQFPNTFRRLFAEGAFNAAFVPLFAKEIETHGTEGAKRFSEEVFGVLFTALLALTIIMELSMPLIVRYLVAPGFAGTPGKFDTTVTLATIMFPYLICMSLGAMMAGMLNSLRRYFAAAVAPVFLNIILIGVLAYAWYKGSDALTVGYGLSWGVLAAGLVQLAIVWVAVRHAGISIGFRRPKMTPAVKRLLILALPAAITGGITQINQLIGTAIASAQNSAVSSLAYADRIYQLPLGVVGVAVAIVLLPELSRALKSGNLIEAANLQNRSVEFTLFLTLPAAAALWVLSEPIV